MMLVLLAGVAWGRENLSQNNWMRFKLVVLQNPINSLYSGANVANMLERCSLFLQPSYRMQYTYTRRIYLCISLYSLHCYLMMYCKVCIHQSEQKIYNLHSIILVCIMLAPFELWFTTHTRQIPFWVNKFRFFFSFATH